ncbi:ribonuclease P protein subunit p38 [Pholidichthys leucotaenia]
MATSGKKIKESKKPSLSKTYFTSPFIPKWSPLPEKDMHFILNILKEKLASTGLMKKEVKVFRPWRRKKVQKPADASEPVSQDKQGPDTSGNGWTDVVTRRQLAIGINEVTRALERNELQLLLVCKSAKPIHMTNHLIGLSATRGVSACQVPRLSENMSGPLGLKSVLALGFKRCSSRDDEVFSDTVDAIKAVVPALDMAWLHCTALGGRPEDAVGGEGGGEKRGQKRKLEHESEVPASPSSCTLQPLSVKKIIANPTKKRKEKPKK